MATSITLFMILTLTGKKEPKHAQAQSKIPYKRRRFNFALQDSTTKQGIMIVIDEHTKGQKKITSTIHLLETKSETRCHNKSFDTILFFVVNFRCSRVTTHLMSKLSSD